MHRLEAIGDRSQVSDHIIDISSALKSYPVLRIEAESDRKTFCNGGSVNVSTPPCDRIRILDNSGEFLGLGKITVEGELRPLKVICG
jgi:hypothetical protein